MRYRGVRRQTLFRVTLAAAVLLMLATTSANVAVQTAEQPRYLATAIMADGSDRNVQVFADRAASEVVSYDASGHGELPSWTAKPSIVPGPIVPWAVRMGWSVAAYMEPVAAGTRPLRYCAAALRAFDAANNDRTAAIAVAALTAKFTGPFNTGQSFDIPPPVEDCTLPDIVLHADADSREIGCWQANTLACAALVSAADGRPVTYVSFGGPLRVAGQLPDRCIAAAIAHESGHAGDLSHSGRYGGEGRRHPHPSDMGYMNMQTCRPEDNPSDAPAIEDWLSQDAHSFTWGFQTTVTPEPFDFDAVWNDGFSTGFNQAFQIGYCAALPAHPGCQ